MRLDAETRATMTYLSALALLLSQGVVAIVAGTGKVSELVLGAVLIILVPESIRLVREGLANGK